LLKEGVELQNSLDTSDQPGEGASSTHERGIKRIQTLDEDVARLDKDFCSYLNVDLTLVVGTSSQDLRETLLEKTVVRGAEFKSLDVTNSVDVSLRGRVRCAHWMTQAMLQQTLKNVEGVGAVHLWA